jgi:predicted MFS family arabinose efflux permease
VGSGGNRDDFSAQQVSRLLLWASYFFTLLVVYLMLNWLPSLMVAKGYSHTQAAASSIALNIGAIMGSVLVGRMTDGGLPRATLVVAYVGMASALIVLALGRGNALFLVAFLAGKRWKTFSSLPGMARVNPAVETGHPSTRSCRVAID